jgi:L-lactate dehydrogenase complex protein LldF
VLLDNGRSNILNGPAPEVLRCIRCGACLNACPVYRNVGGHAYNSVYPGPIGSLLTPLLYGPQHHELPRASSLCGACKLACPVKIDIPGLLVRLRSMGRSLTPLSKRVGIRGWAWFMRHPRLYRWGQRLLRRKLHAEWTSKGPGPLGDWTVARDLPAPPPRSFRQLWQEELGDGR